MDSLRGGTQGHTGASPVPYDNGVNQRHPMDNYFNTRIVERHDDHMWLNNSMAETYDFCLSIATGFRSDADCAWYYEQKKSFLCYDV